MKYWRKTLDRDRIKAPHYEIRVENDLCKGCRFCLELCPRNVLHESGELNKKGYRPVYGKHAEECVHCGLCEMVCPEFAIKIVPAEEAHGQ